MRNSDQISFVCITTGGSRGNGKTIGNKIRFTNDKARYIKALGKLGATQVEWVNLPNPMTKIEAVQYVQSLTNVPAITTAAAQDAIAKAVARLTVTPKATSTKKSARKSK